MNSSMSRPALRSKTGSGSGLLAIGIPCPTYRLTRRRNIGFSPCLRQDFIRRLPDSFQAETSPFTSEASDVVGKRLQVLDELVPGNRTVAVLMNPDTPFSALALRELKAAAAVTAQPIQAVEARSADQVVTGVEAAAKAGAPGHGGNGVAGEYSSANRRSRHNDSAAIVYGSRAFPEAGGLISYGVDRR